VREKLNGMKIFRQVMSTKEKARREKETEGMKRFRQACQLKKKPREETKKQTKGRG
jgi:hypothetical protein